jgi:hypothetical protein
MLVKNQKEPAMSRRIASVLLLLSSLLAGAANASSALPKRTTVTLDQPAKVGASVLPAGTYQVELSSNVARFVQAKRTVAEAPVKVGVEAAQYRGNALHYKDEAGQQRLLKIVFAPSGIAVEFPADPASTGASTAAAGH